jgi:hypothetical protein
LLFEHWLNSNEPFRTPPTTGQELESPPHTKPASVAVGSEVVVSPLHAATVG